jgi:tryptophan 2,3-dioxygenase
VAKDYSVPVLSGEGADDYARYMRCDTLLSLQRRPDEWIHRDELLFQVVHQSTELWLKLAGAEMAEAATCIRTDRPDVATRLLGRASLAFRLLTGQLEMLRHLTPWDFQLIRTVLGHGSGFESPGWQGIRQRGQDLGAAIEELVTREKVDLVELYRGSPEAPLYRLCEALIECDEHIAVWRTVHYKIATRIIGHQVVGTKGTNVDVLVNLIGYKFFPELWRIRTELTKTGPMGVS